MSGRKLKISHQRSLASLVGNQFTGPHRSDAARVMGVVEGYIVARHKGEPPFLLHWRDFEKTCRMVNQVK